MCHINQMDSIKRYAIVVRHLIIIFILRVAHFICVLVLGNFQYDAFLYKSIDSLRRVHCSWLSIFAEYFELCMEMRKLR